MTGMFPKQRPVTVPNSAPVTSGWQKRPGALARSLLFIGNLDYPPNRDAVQRLVLDILPLLRSSQASRTLHIAGRGSTDLKRLYESVTELHWHGYVEDLEPLYRAADIAIVPLRAGGGSRIKILEAMSHGLPVVATAKAVEGLNVTPGQHYVLAETNEEFARRIEGLLQDFTQRETLCMASRRLILSQYSPETVYAQLLKL